LSSDGTTAAIGAYSNDANNLCSGHVRVYGYDLALLAWVQLGDDIDGEAGADWAGWSVSLSADGTIVAIGAPNNDDNGAQSGHVRVYEYESSSWVQLGSDIDGEAADDHFGWIVSLSADGTRLAIGAPQNNGYGSNSGHVRVYDYDSSALAWVKLGDDIDGEAANDHLGWTVSLSDDGSTVAIGSNANKGGGTSAAYVRVYEYDTSLNDWIQLGNDIDGVASDEWLSVSLSADGKHIAIGAPSNDGDGSDSGLVNIFIWDGSDWCQTAFDVSGEIAGDYFGYSVSLSADGLTVAIGAPDHGAYGGNSDDETSGQVKVFQHLISS